MDDNRIEIVASLDIPKTVSTIKSDLDKVKKQLDADGALSIACNIDHNSLSILQNQIGEISKKLKIDIPKIEFDADAERSAVEIENVSKQFDNANNKALTLKKTLADLESKFTKPFKAVFDDDGLINAERTMSAIQSRLSSLGTVTVTGKYNDQESADSINRIVARIEAMSGEVRELNFLLDSTDDKFKLLNSSYSDKGVGKVQQDLARLSKELANFEASHKSIESGLIEPLTVARNAIIDLESGVGSVESAQKALDNLKTVAANIGSNLKSTGSSFNVFDNAANKAENFDNTIKTLKMDIDSLSPSTSKSFLVSQLDLAIERMNEFKDVESKSGRGVEWSQRYGEISSLLQNITNNLKVAQKEENAFNKEFEQAVKEEEKQLAIEQKRVETTRQLRESQQHDYWQGRFEETVKGMTAENQVLKDMKKYYEDLNKAQKEVEKQEKKTFQEDNRIANLQNRIKRLTADVNAYGEANERATKSMRQMSNGKTFAVEWSRITTEMAKGADLTDRELKDLSADMAVFRKEAQAAGLAGESAFGKFANSFKVMSSYITANMVFNFVKRQLRDMVQEVTAVDTAMVELRKVTEATDEQFEAFARSAGQTGRELGASVSDVINATSTFARLGESLPDAEELGKVATLYKNVGYGIDIETASEDIISTMKAFKIEAKDAITIVDKLNEVETCPFYILVERNRRHIFSNCWEILKSFSLLFSKRRKSETSKRITYGEKKHIQSAKVVCVLSVV